MLTENSLDLVEKSLNERIPSSSPPSSQPMDHYKKILLKSPYQPLDKFDKTESHEPDIDPTSGDLYLTHHRRTSSIAIYLLLIMGAVALVTWAILLRAAWDLVRNA